MKVIGLTGSIGTGKSTVADILRNVGVPVLDADMIGHEVYRPGTGAYEKIVSAFGRKVLNKDGTVNRKVLGDLVFRDEKKRTELERITHPEIEKRMREFIKVCEKEGHRFCIIEAALIFEKDEGSLFDQVVTVSANRIVQIERLKKRDGLSERELVKRIEAQLPLQEKVEKSDHEIDNSGSLKETERQVYRLIETLENN